MSGIGRHVPRGQHGAAVWVDETTEWTRDQQAAIGKLMQAMLGDPPPDGMPYVHRYLPPVEPDLDDEG